MYAAVKPIRIMVTFFVVLVLLNFRKGGTISVGACFLTLPMVLRDLSQYALPDVVLVSLTPEKYYHDFVHSRDAAVLKGVHHPVAEVVPELVPLLVEGGPVLCVCLVSR